MKRITTNYIIIHCSDTPSSMDIGANEIRQWHINERNFIDIAYHFVIRRNGTRELGRNIEDVGSHTKGFNSSSVGICLVGGWKEMDNFTPPQWKELEVLVKELKLRYPKAEVLGHCNLNAGKTCPNFDVIKWYSTINKET
jgi:N-acetyl-anhydromuramyl-L-alanine amidase AmpD